MYGDTSGQAGQLVENQGTGDCHVDDFPLPSLDLDDSIEERPDFLKAAQSARDQEG